MLVVATERGPITTRRNLALLSRWQRRIAAEPGVRAVIGPEKAMQQNGDGPFRRPAVTHREDETITLERLHVPSLP